MPTRKTEEELDISLRQTSFFTDSADVLAWINNTRDRFPIYVANRVKSIRESSGVQQWHLMPSQQNPADIGTRPLNAEELRKSFWTTGPQFLKTSDIPTFLEKCAPTYNELDASIMPLGHTRPDFLFSHECESDMEEEESTNKGEVAGASRVLKVKLATYKPIWSEAMT